MFHFFRVFLLFFVSFCSIGYARDVALVITHHFNRPDFIEIQFQTLKKFMRTPYRFVVFNDAKTCELEDAIQSSCDRLGVECIRIPQNIHKTPNDPAIACADVVNYSLQNLGLSHDGYMMILDADMFLVKPFDIDNYMKDTIIAGHPQVRGHVNYIWNGIFILDVPNLIDKQSVDFSCGMVEGELCDVGGYMYYYFQKHPEIRMKAMVPHYYLGNFYKKDLRLLPPFAQWMCQQRNYNCEFFIGDTFFHYRSGGNWDHRSASYHIRKTKILHQFIEKVMKETY